MTKKLLIALYVAVLVIIIPCNVALAIGNPDTLSWGTGASPRYKVVYNINETGDWLISAEGYVYYGSEPTDYTADEAFLFELLNEAGNETYASTTVKSYGNRPISIYLSSTQVTTLGLTVGNGYKIRITGNPSVFPTQTGNTITTTLVGDNYVDQSLSGNTTTTNNLRNVMMGIARSIEANDAPLLPYIITVNSIEYLTPEGADIFLEGVPGLNTMCPVLFQYSASLVSGDKPSSTGSYASILTPESRWGTNVADSLTMVGLWLGINQALAGATIAGILGALLAIIVYKKLESGMATLMLVATYPFLIAWLGLMPLALAFVIMMVVVILGGWYFFRQGAL